MARRQERAARGHRRRATYFKLNTRPDVVRRFFEEICLKRRGTDLSRGGGWDTMLADTCRQQMVAAIQAEARRHTSEEISANRGTLLAMHAAIGSYAEDAGQRGARR